MHPFWVNSDLRWVWRHHSTNPTWTTIRRVVWVLQDTPQPSCMVCRPLLWQYTTRMARRPPDASFTWTTRSSASTYEQHTPSWSTHHSQGPGAPPTIGGYHSQNGRQARRSPSPPPLHGYEHGGPMNGGQAVWTDERAGATLDTGVAERWLQSKWPGRPI